MVQRLLAALLLAGATAQSTEGGVFVLTDGTAKSFIDSKPITLVHYYAQWCAKCKTLAPKLEKVAEKAKAKGWPIAIAKVDAKEQEEAAKDVYGYPTLKIFHGKDSSEYEGPREVDDIMKYLERLVTSQTLPTMKAPADLTKLAKAGKEPVVLGLFREPVKASAAYKTFKEAAFEFHGQGVKFAYSAGATNPPVAPLNAVGQQGARTPGRADHRLVSCSPPLAPCRRRWARSRRCRGWCSWTPRARRRRRGCPCRARRTTSRSTRSRTGSARTACP